MENLQKIKRIIETSRKLREKLDGWNNIISENSCDKYGLGFNKDSRFSSTKISLSVDSWVGYYGNSGCSTYLQIQDQESFKKAFISVLNDKFRMLLLETCAKMEMDAKSYIDKAREEIRENLKVIDEIEKK